jgi:hypothetical protein
VVKHREPYELISFFTDGAGSLSMSRLLCFLAFWPATYMALSINDTEALAWYLSVFVGGYVGGKLPDAFTKKKTTGG